MGGGLEEGGLEIHPERAEADSFSDFSRVFFRVVFQVTFFYVFSNFLLSLGVPGGVIFCEILKSVWFFNKNRDLRF